MPERLSRYLGQLVVLLSCVSASALCAQRSGPIGGSGGSPFRPPVIAPAQQAPQAQPESTIHVSVRRVALDVTVTDDKGRPVSDLAAGDFQVFEDRVPQPIRSFHLNTIRAAAPGVTLPSLPPNTFANLPRNPASGPPTVILCDLLNTPRDAQSFARAQLLSFLRKRTENSQMAIFVLSDRLYLVQGFTDDSKLLIAALSGKSQKAYRSQYLQAPGEATQGSDMLASTEGNQNGADDQADAGFQQIAAMSRHMETMESSYLTDRRVDITVGALQDIAHFLVNQPGRKNLLWLSGSFPSGIVPDPDADSRDSMQVTRNYSELVVAATDVLTASHVAVYPIDVRGLEVYPMFSADTKQAFEPGQRKDSRAVRDFGQNKAAEYATMDKIADSTGGHAFYNTNGLEQAERAAEQEGSTYYALTYAPTNATLDKGLRHVRVVVKRPGVHVAYRRSYFADNLDNLAQTAADQSGQALAAAAQHGAPLLQDIFFEAHVEAEGTPQAATPQQLEELVHYEGFATAKLEKAAAAGTPLLLQRYVIQFVLLPRQLDVVTGTDQLRHVHVDVAAISYDVDGMALFGRRTDLQDVIHNDRWAMMLREGYHIPMVLLVPANARFIRLAVQDAGSRRAGSLEITLPLSQTASAAPAKGQ